MKHNISFRKRLLGAFLICTLVPLIIYSMSMVKISQIQFDIQEKNHLQQQITSISQDLDIISEGLKGVTIQLKNNPYIENALLGKNVDETQVNNLLYLGTNVVRNFASLELYNLQGKLLYSTSDNYESTTLPTWWGVLHNATLRDGEPAFQAGLYKSNNENPLFQGAVLLKNKDNIPLGYIVLTMHQKDFYNLFEGKLGAQDNLLLVNKFFHPVYGSSNYIVNDVGPKIRKIILNENTDGFNTKDYLTEIKNHVNTGLYIILLREKVLNTNASRLLYIVSIICAALGIVISILISIPLRKQIFAPIHRLQKAFHLLGKGNLNIQLPMDKTDEINQLSADFNKMVKALKQNQVDLIKKQKDLNTAQINLMQTQLNPHFLCNTLDTIKWISKINNVPQTGEIAANLADILRFCLKPEQFVPLYKEIEVINLYIEIQKIRISDDFTFVVNVPEDLELAIVPKMMLQPIVENSIIHGLDGKENCYIEVNAKRMEDKLIIKVIDNGKGIPEELVGKKYEHTAPVNGHHLGLNNINTIISKYYGEEYGVYMDRGFDNIGTEVTVVLPVREEADND